MKRLVRFCVAIAAVAWAMAAIGGCNTVRGVGKDIEAGGKKIQKAVE